VRLALCLLILPVRLFGASQSGWVGTYTSAGGKATGSYGIYSFAWDAKSGSLTEVRTAAATTNPAFLALHPNGRFLYAVNEDASSSGIDRITAFAIGPLNASLAVSKIGSVPSMGRAPYHLSIDARGKWLFVANYLTGNIAVYPIQSDGRLGQAKQVIQQQGSGPVTGRQESAHAHEIMVSPDGRFVLAVDLGADKIFIYHFDSATGALAPNNPPAIEFMAGYGPRHLVFSKNSRFAYVITELVPAIVTLRWDGAHG
jgi:6-phosphogluconolactonase